MSTTLEYLENGKLLLNLLEQIWEGDYYFCMLSLLK